MKTRVLVPVNMRTGRPEVLPDNNPGDLFFNVGDSIDVDCGVMGEKYKDSNLWYRLAEGSFVWSGAVDKTNLTVPVSELAGNPFLSVINYNKNAFAEFPDWVKKTGGRGVKIAVIDSGLSKSNPSFAGDSRVRSLPNAIESPHGEEDKTGHGSHVAGLIGARSVTNVGIIGMAPEAELLAIKFTDDDDSTSAIDLREALIIAIETKVDIINLSVSVNKKKLSIFDKELKGALERGIVVVAAASRTGDDPATAGRELLCPANQDGVIAVDSCTDAFIKSTKNFNPQLNWIIPHNFLWSCYNRSKTYEAQRGSSMATALVTGLFALAMSATGLKDRIQLMQFLNRHSVPVSRFNANQVSIYYPFQ